MRAKMDDRRIRGVNMRHATEQLTERLWLHGPFAVTVTERRAGRMIRQRRYTPTVSSFRRLTALLTAFCSDPQPNVYVFFSNNQQSMIIAGRAEKIVDGHARQADEVRRAINRAVEKAAAGGEVAQT